MFQLHKLRSAEGSAIVSFALGAPLVLALTLGVLNVSGVVWSREVANNILNRMVIEGSKEDADLSAISSRWQSALSRNHLVATPIQWTIKKVGASTRVIAGHTEVTLLTIGLPLAQTSALDVQVVLE